MELSYDDVLGILDLLDNSKVEYLEIEVGDTKLIASASGMTLAKSLESGLPAVSTTSGDQTPLAAHSVGEASAFNVESPQNESNVDASLVSVLAPVVGVFYRQSEPGSPPFVEIGSRVEAGSTLGLMEVMKMFASVTSPVKGQIVQIMVENEEFAEFEQPLILIRPDIQA